MDTAGQEKRKEDTGARDSGVWIWGQILKWAVNLESDWERVPGESRDNLGA